MQAQYNYYILNNFLKKNNFLNIIKYSINTQLSHKYILQLVCSNQNQC